MANRDVGISVCGVVVGVMLGAGSVLYTQDASLNAAASSDEVAAYWNLDEARDSNARNIEKRTREQVGARKLELKDAPVYEQAKPAADEQDAAPAATDCGIASAILDRMDSAIRSTVPAEEGAGGNDKIQRDALLSVSATIRDEHCNPSDASEKDAVKESVKPAAKSKRQVFNNCPQWAPGSIRRGKCDANSQHITGPKTYTGH